MAKGDLYRAIERAREILAQASPDFRAGTIDKETHIYTVSSKEIRYEIYLELEDIFGVKDIASAVPPGALTPVNRLVEAYVDRLRQVFAKRKYCDISKTVGPGVDFTLTIRKGVDGAPQNIFNWIKVEKRGPRDLLVNGLNEFLPILSETLGSFQTRDISKEKFLDLGHKEAVVDLQTAKAIDKIKAAEKRNPEISQILPAVIKMYFASEHFGTFNKKFIIQIKDESALANNDKSKQEKARKDQVKKALTKWAKENDWAKQKGSDSVLELIEKSVILEASKSKSYRGPKPKKTDRANNSVETEIKSKTKVVRSKDSVGVQGTKGSVHTRPKGTQIDLVTLINAKLTEEVRKRMTYPRLQNRSGRFASSVRVTDVTQTAQGFPSIGYTYMRMPYETFEPGRKQGSVERDPKRLINESIRAIAGQYLESRFFTRRM